MSNSLEAKIVVLGSQGVGKTSLVHRYVKNAFTPPTTQSTIGASFLTKRVVDIDTSTVVRLQIWDTAGQERFRSISKLYYRGTLTVTPRHTMDIEYAVMPSGCPCLLYSLPDSAVLGRNTLAMNDAQLPNCPNIVPWRWSELTQAGSLYAAGPTMLIRTSNRRECSRTLL